MPSADPGGIGDQIGTSTLRHLALTLIFARIARRYLAGVIRTGGADMKFRTNEMAAVDKIVAACDGNVHGALEVLLLLNEHLEAEIQQLYTTLSRANPGHSLLVGAQH